VQPGPFDGLGVAPVSPDVEALPVVRASDAHVLSAGLPVSRSASTGPTGIPTASGRRRDERSRPAAASTGLASGRRRDRRAASATDAAPLAPTPALPVFTVAPAAAPAQSAALETTAAKTAPAAAVGVDPVAADLGAAALDAAALEAAVASEAPEAASDVVSDAPLLSADLAAETAVALHVDVDLRTEAEGDLTGVAARIASDAQAEVLAQANELPEATAPVEPMNGSITTISEPELEQAGLAPSEAAEIRTPLSTEPLSDQREDLELRVATARSHSAQVPLTTAPTAIITPLASKRARRIRRTRRAVFTGMAVTAIALMTVVTSMPAAALATAMGTPLAGSVSDSSGDATQSFTASGDSSTTDVSSSDYSSVTAAQSAAEAGYATANTYVNNPDAKVQWPFAVGVPISSYFGARNVAGCSFCSTMHPGVDLIPGYGTPIHAAAAGVVLAVGEFSGYGNWVEIGHDVDGRKFVTIYGHTIDGSQTVAVGDHVKLGQVIAKVGDTGNSTGAHLHFEIRTGGTDWATMTPVDPMVFMQKYDPS
jgi:murein DD-endopeptidase MepM/ murein hydrolase activator NlpD